MVDLICIIDDFDNENQCTLLFCNMLINALFIRIKNTLRTSLSVVNALTTNCAQLRISSKGILKSKTILN